MSEDVMLQQAIDAIMQGQQIRARDLLTRLLRADQKNPAYWIWMSSVVDSHNERIYCLESALRQDPFNRIAIRGLVLLGARASEEDIKPLVPVRRKNWNVTGVQQEVRRTGFQRIWGNPFLRFALFAIIGALVVGLIFVGVLSVRKLYRNELAIIRVSITPRPTFTLSPTITPTRTPLFRSPTPTFARPTPLWMLLDATYTPAPLYVNTPHPVSEAYGAGLRSLNQGNYESMLNFMLQAVFNDPNSPDVYYYLGEAYRLQGDNENALDAYNQAITIDPAFAPGYMGRARTLIEINPKADITKDFEKALDLDPNLAEAYLLRAMYSLNQGDPKAALKDLAIAVQLIPESPLVYLDRAQVYLKTGENASALEDARRAYDMDRTLLPAYLILGQSYLANGEPLLALGPLETYLLYRREDPLAWLAVGKAHLAQKDYQTAMKDFDQVLTLDKKLAEAYYYRGLDYLALEEGQKAVNEFATALRLDPYSFDTSLELGHALLMADRPKDASLQLKSSEALAENDGQFARLYYWRALDFEALGLVRDAIDNWRALLKLPPEVIPEGWIDLANQHLQVLATTPTLSPTASPTTSPTMSPTMSPTPSVTPAPTSTTTVTPTPTPSLVPRGP